MEISSRNPKNVSTDRLSFLPDDVICHILSFLPTKISVSTSILARRWRSLWVHVPNLDFSNHMNYLKPKSYSEIITSVMVQRKTQSINTFRLSYETRSWSCELEAWITNAISCNVRCFDLSLNFRFTIPRQIFTCGTLVSLKLDSCLIGTPSGDTVSLPNLKKLHLYSVHCEADKTIPRLLSGCPVLEELIFSVSYLLSGSENLNCWNISSPTINRLTLKLPFHKVRVFAPALVYLQLYNCTYKNISLCNLSSLVEAHIFVYSEFIREDFNKPIYLFDFLNQVRNVQRLKLSGVSILEFLIWLGFNDIGSSQPILKFYNLTNLDTDGDWRFLTKLLECADNLQDLIIRESYTYWGVTDRYLKISTETVERRHACLCSLRTVTFDKFGCKEAEFELVRYLMRNAKVLKMMKIRFYKDFICAETKSDATRRILSLEKGHETCELVFC